MSYEITNKASDLAAEVERFEGYVYARINELHCLLQAAAIKLREGKRCPFCGQTWAIHDEPSTACKLRIALEKP